MIWNYLNLLFVVTSNNERYVMHQHVDQNNEVVLGETNLIDTVRTMIKSDPQIAEVSETTVQQIVALMVQTANTE